MVSTIEIESLILIHPYNAYLSTLCSTGMTSQRGVVAIIICKFVYVC